VSAWELANAELKLYLGVIGTNAYRAIEMEYVRSEGTFPDRGIINKDAEVFAVHLRTERVRISRLKDRDGRFAGRPDVSVAAIGTLGARMLAGIRLYGDDEFRLGLDAPHHVNQVARVLGTQLETELPTHLARAEPGVIFRGAQIDEARFDRLRGLTVHVPAHLGDTYGQALARHFLERTFCDTKHRACHAIQAAVRAPRERDDSPGENGHRAHNSQEIPLSPHRLDLNTNARRNAKRSVLPQRQPRAALAAGHVFARGWNDTLQTQVDGHGAVAFAIVRNVS